MSSPALFAAEDRSHVLPDGQTGLTGHRAARWVWDMLDKDENHLGDFAGISGGSIDINVHADTRASGSFTWHGTWDDLPDWDQLRVRPRYVAEFPDGSSVDWPMGVYLLATPALTDDDGAVSGTVDFYDKTLILRQDAIEEAFGLDVGTDVTGAVRALVEGSVQAGVVAVEDSDQTLRTAMVWPAGTSKLRIVNDLLAAIDYFAVWSDDVGTLRAAPYRPPSQRPVEYRFVDGHNAIFTSGWTQERDTFEVPNKVIAISEGDGNMEALVSVATLDELDVSHPLGYGKRGRWVTRVEENVEATSQEVLDAYAYRLIRESVQTAQGVEFTHAPIPLAMNGRYTFAHSGRDAVYGVLQQTRIDCTPAALWASTIREAVS